MPQYHVLVTMPDGSEGRHEGNYPCSGPATERAMDLFPGAAMVETLRPLTAMERSIRRAQHRGRLDRKEPA